MSYTDPNGHSPKYLDGEQFVETDKSQGFNNNISATDRGKFVNNANNWKPLSDKDKQVPFWGYDHEKDDGSDLLEGTHGNNTEDYYTDAELYGLIATGIVVESGLVVAEVSLIILQLELAGAGLPGVAFDVFVITPIEIFIMDVGIGIAKYIYEAGQTRQKPEFELTIFPMIFDLFRNEEKTNEGSHE